MNKFQVIGISGNAGAGKDYVFDHFFKPKGYFRFALADHFKIWAVGRSLLTYEEAFITKPPHVRHIMQQAGTEEGRDIYGVNIWLDTTAAWLTHLNNTMGITKFCITDARFPNEVEYIQNELQGKVLRIDAPDRVAQNKLSDDARKHPSETALDGFDKFDYLLNNRMDRTWWEVEGDLMYFYKNIATNV